MLELIVSDEIKHKSCVKYLKYMSWNFYPSCIQCSNSLHKFCTVYCLLTNGLWNWMLINNPSSNWTCVWSNNDLFILFQLFYFKIKFIIVYVLINVETFAYMCRIFLQIKLVLFICNLPRLGYLKVLGIQTENRSHECSNNWLSCAAWIILCY